MIELKPWRSISVGEHERVVSALYDAQFNVYPLSGFLGGRRGGGPRVNTLEENWKEAFSVNHALSVNSATSGLLAALKACGAGPGTQVICSPYSMSAGVSAVVWCGAEPVFADIDETRNMSPGAATACIGPQTVAILATDLFGGASNIHDLAAVATENHLHLIEDAAQAPFARTERGKFAGTIGDVGVYSLNVHKPMQAGEGGIVVTNIDDIADDIDGIRNHGELRGLPPGLNLRMTELTAAVAIEQLAKGPEIVAYRNKLAKRLTEALKGNLNIMVPPHDPNSAYYIWHCTTMPSYRGDLVYSLNSRGVPVKEGYVQPLHLMSAFHQFYRDCPVVKRIDSQIITLEMYAWDLNEDLIDQIAEAFWRSVR